MLKNSLAIVCAIMAVSNGVIAVFVLVFPLQSGRDRYLLLLVISALSLVAVASATSALKHSAAFNTRRVRRLEQVQKDLDELLQQGTVLLGRVRKEQEPFPIVVAERWNLTTSSYLDRTLGAAFVLRFGEANKCMAEPLRFEDRGLIDEALRTRTARLRQIIDELNVAQIAA
jgi:hypothetical protein